MTEQLSLDEYAKRIGFKDMCEKDMQDFCEAKKKILEILLDGKPHSKFELREATGIDSADRRVRELREVHGYEIETIKTGNRNYVYKLVGKKAA